MTRVGKGTKQKERKQYLKEIQEAADRRNKDEYPDFCEGGNYNEYWMNQDKYDDMEALAGFALKVLADRAKRKKKK